MVEANRPVSTTTPARLAFPTLMVHRSWITMRAATNSPPNRPAFSERLPIRCTPCKRKNRYLTTRKANSSERRTALSALMSVFIQVYYILLSNNDTVPVVPGEVAHPTGYSTQTSTIQRALNIYRWQESTVGMGQTDRSPIPAHLKSRPNSNIQGKRLKFNWIDKRAPPDEQHTRLKMMEEDTNRSKTVY